MRIEGLVRLLVGYTLLLAAACFGVQSFAALGGKSESRVVASVWRAGELIGREVLASRDRNSAQLDSLAAASPAASLVYEEIEGTSRVLTTPDFVFALSFVGGRDGIVATLDGRTAYVTPDDLLKVQAFDRGVRFGAVGLGMGVDTERLWALLGERLNVRASDVKSRASLRRLRFRRSTPGKEPPPQSTMTPEALTPAVATAAMLDGAGYLARGIQRDGHFRYLVDAPSNQTLPGYDWPRHAGATYFLAQAAAVSHEPEIAMACLRAGALIGRAGLQACGATSCVGDEEGRVDLGSSALALVAFVEIVRTGLDPRYTSVVKDLAGFLRAQQRPDGEFMHEYDRVRRRPIDVQYVYYSGEATLALARAYEITHDPVDLEAARRGLSHLIGPAWSFFGDRYYFGEEHWTCQAMGELWNAAPNADALDFCVRWQRYGRRMQYHAGESAYDADGAFGVGPWLTPRLTPVASRCEAGIATLDILRRTGRRQEAEALEAQLRRALALLIRSQLRPGPSELFVDPAAVHGAMPGSQVDLELRIDYAQHAGSAMARWLSLAAR